jgi:hypothetical protein
MTSPVYHTLAKNLSDEAQPKQFLEDLVTELGLKPVPKLSCCAQF